MDMRKVFQLISYTIMIGFSGLIAVHWTIPLLSSWFGVTLTITGASAVAEMYLYLLSSFIVAVGLIIGIFTIAFLIGLARSYVKAQ